MADSRLERMKKISASVASEDSSMSGNEPDRLSRMRQINENPEVIQHKMNSNPNMGFLESVGRSIPAVWASAARNTANIPHNLFNTVSTATEPLFNSIGMEKAYNPFPSLYPGYDYYEAMGVEPNIVSGLAQGALETIAPFGAASKISGGLNSLGQNIGAGLLTGVSQENATQGSTALSGALGGVGHLAGAAINKIPQAWNNFYAKASVPTLMEKGFDLFKRGRNIPEKGSELLQGAFNEKNSVNNQNWSNLENLVNKIDEGFYNKSPSRMGAFSRENVGAKPYVEAIDKFIKEKSSLSPFQKEEYSEAIDFANYIKDKNLIPQNFMDLVKGRQILNDAYKGYLRKRNLTAENSKTKEFIVGMKDAIKDIVESDAIQKVVPKDIRDLFNSLWEKANKSHQELQKFRMAPDNSGILQKNSNLEKAYKASRLGSESSYSDTGLLKEFEPKSRSTKTPGLEQLEKLVGQNASRILKDYSFRNVGNDVALLNQFRKLSPQQQKSFFGNSSEYKNLKATQELAEKYGVPKSKTVEDMMQDPISLLHGGGIAGGAWALHHLGVPWGAAIPLAISSSSVPKIIGNAITKRATPEKAIERMRRAEKERNNYGGFLGGSISQTLNNISRK